MPNTQSASRFGPVSPSDIARVQAQVARAAKEGTDAEWQSWCRILKDVERVYNRQKLRLET